MNTEHKPDISQDMHDKWQKLANVLASVAEVPSALVMRVNPPEIEVCISSQSENNPYKQGEKAKLNTGLYCEFVMSSGKDLFVPDALKDPVWDHNPDIALGMTFYYGFPILWPDGASFGTICILDSVPHEKSSNLTQLMETLKEVIEQDLRVAVNTQLMLQNEQQQMEERLRLAMKAANQAWFDLNVQTGEVMVSPEYGPIIGYTPEEFKSSLQNWMDHIHPDDIEAVQKGLKHCLEIKDPVSVEYRRKSKSGDWLWLKVIGEVIEWDKEGNPLRIIGIHQSIDQRRKVEEELRASEHKLFTILENVDAFIYLKDLEGKYLFANKKVRDLWQVDMTEIVGFGDDKFFDATTADNIHKNDLKVLNKGKIVRAEEVNTNLATGQTSAYDSTKLPLYHEDGSIYALCGISIDVTKRKQAEDALKKSEERYRSLFENMLNGFALHKIICDEHGKPIDYEFLELNNAFERMTGLKESVAIGKRVTEIIPGIENDPADWIGRYGRVALEGEAIKFEQYSEPLNKHFSVIAFRPEEGLFATIFEDITNRKTAEIALRKSQDLLAASQSMGQVGGWEVDIATGELTWTDEVYRIHELEPGSDLKLIQGLDFYTPTSRPILEEAFNQTVKHGTPYDLELEIITAKGNLRSVHGIGRADLEHGRVFGFFQDITDLKKLERQLLFERNQAKQYLNIAEVMFCVVEKDEKISLINKKGNEILGYEEGALIGKNWFDTCIPEVVRQEVRSVFNQIINGDITPVEYFENKVLTSHGEKKLLAFHNTIITDDDSHITAVLFSAEDVTEKRSAEIKLAESEKRFRSTFEEAAVGIAHVGLDGSWLRVNQRLCDMLGYARNELLKKTFQDITHPDDLDADLHHVHDMLDNKIERYSMEKRYFHKNGSVVWINLTVALVDNSEGSPDYFISVIEDISERKNIELSLKRVQRAHDEAERIAMLGHYILDISTGVWVSSEGLRNVFGIDESFNSDIEGWLSIVHPDFRDEMSAYFERYVVSQHHQFDRSYKIINFETKEERWVHGLGSLELDEAGNPIIMFGTIQDITERKNAEDSLRESEKDLRQAQSTAHIGSWTFDLDSLMTWSDELYHIFGVTHDFEPTMERFNHLIHPDDLPSFQSWLQDHIDGKQLSLLVFRIINTDGAIRHISGQVNMIPEDSRSPTHLSGTFQDVTERIELEEQFHQAQKMEALGTLVGGIAHDFNNILAGITGNLYMAKSSVQSLPEVDARLNTIEALSFRAAELIKQLLTFARKDRVNVKPIPFVQFIKETSKLMRSAIPENIAMNVIPKIASATVTGDSTQLHQVLMNLINNARDAVSLVKHPFINIILDSVEADTSFMASHPGAIEGSYVLLTIEDNGVGISQKNLEHIFEPFFTTKEVGSGTGLGLSMVFGAVQTHQGFVEVESEEGLGSKFHVYLPIKDVESDLSSSDSDENISEGKGELILIVDDEIDVTQATSDVLEDLGYRVIVAHDGLEAVKLYSEQKDNISLVLMDVVMPKLSGVKAAEKIYKMDSKAKFIFFTGYDKEEALPNNIGNTESTILSKPCEIELLSQTIRNVIDS